MFRVEMAREVRGREGIGIGFVKSSVFSFEWKTCGEIARGEVLVSSWDGSDICRSTGGSLFQRGGRAMAIERLANYEGLKIVSKTKYNLAIVLSFSVL